MHACRVVDERTGAAEPKHFESVTIDITVEPKAFAARPTAGSSIAASRSSAASHDGIASCCASPMRRWA
jgi:hypothetical protein